MLRPLAEERLQDLVADHVRLDAAAPAEDALALVDEDHRALLAGLREDLLDALRALTEVAHLQVGEGERHQQRARRRSQGLREQRLAGPRRAADQQPPRRGRIAGAEHLDPPHERTAHARGKHDRIPDLSRRALVGLQLSPSRSMHALLDRLRLARAPHDLVEELGGRMERCQMLAQRAPEKPPGYVRRKGLRVSR